MPLSFLARALEPPAGPNGLPLVGIASFVTPLEGYLLMRQHFEQLPDGGLMVTLETDGVMPWSYPVHRAHVETVSSPAVWARSFAELCSGLVTQGRMHRSDVIWSGALTVRLAGVPKLPPYPWEDEAA